LEIEDLLNSKMPLSAEMKEKLEHLKARPSQKKSEEWAKKVKAELLSEMLDAAKIKAGGAGQIEKVKDIAELISRAAKENASVVVAGVSVSSIGTGFIERSNEGLIFHTETEAPRMLKFSELPQVIREELNKKATL
jgi:hypothetical protein